MPGRNGIGTPQLRWARDTTNRAVETLLCRRACPQAGVNSVAHTGQRALSRRVFAILYPEYPYRRTTGPWRGRSLAFYDASSALAVLNSRWAIQRVGSSRSFSMMFRVGFPRSSWPPKNVQSSGNAGCPAPGSAGRQSSCRGSRQVDKSIHTVRRGRPVNRLPVTAHLRST